MTNQQGDEISSPMRSIRIRLHVASPPRVALVERWFQQCEIMPSASGMVELALVLSAASDHLSLECRSRFMRKAVRNTPDRLLASRDHGDARRRWHALSCYRYRPYSSDCPCLAECTIREHSWHGLTARHNQGCSGMRSMQFWQAAIVIPPMSIVI